MACLSIAEGGDVRELPWRQLDSLYSEAVFALYFKFRSFDVWFGGADDDPTDDEEFGDHAALDVSYLDGVVIAPQDYLPLLVLRVSVLILPLLQVGPEGSLHHLEDFEGVVG